MSRIRKPTHTYICEDDMTLDDEETIRRIVRQEIERALGKTRPHVPEIVFTDTDLMRMLAERGLTLDDIK